MSQQELLKQAFVLGVIRAISETGIEKTAIMPLLRTLASKALPTASKALPAATNAARFATYGGGPLAEKFSPVAKKYISDTLTGGALGAAGDVLGGDKTKPWYERAGRGWLGGAVSGAAFRGGIEGGRNLLGRAGRSQWLGNQAPNFAKRLTSFTSQDPGHSTIGGIWNYAKGGGTVPETAKRLGVYALGGAPLVASGYLAGDKGSALATKAMGGGGEGSAAAGAAAAAMHPSAAMQPRRLPMAYNFVPQQGEPYPTF